MDFCSHRLLLIIVCFGLLACKPDKVHSLRWNQELSTSAKKERILTAAAAAGVVNLEAREKLAAHEPPLPFDPNSMSKRKVRRGSDPIHNRC
ncbi:hypothetical protein Cni_G24286 [Canna indica]|uniref:Uncharacterized protein n=1 Tax=Canna indica TaxID=4628 RepID=A0AAQ3KVP4_9LILI|nr:hypothetical protein Cni_G24286 [Canna indica]